MTTILVAGALANKPRNGGEAWVRLSWALGFRRLGFDVVLVEQISPATCIDEQGASCRPEESVNLRYFCDVTGAFALPASLVTDDGTVLSGDDPRDLAADLLVNISGHLRLEAVLCAARRRVYVDIDPGYTQIWHATGRLRVDAHDAYLTIGENVGRPECPIPTGGIQWRPVRQPVVLEHWPVACGGEPNRLTTIATWRGGYGSIAYAGTTHGQKLHELRKLVTLPRLVRQECEIALDIHPGDERDARALREHGWRLVDPREVAADPWTFRDYVQGSGGELSVAQGVYADTASGWFSDRSARYLASGRPVLVQDTGSSRTIPTGEGLVAFRGIEEAVAGAEAIASNYERHRRAARALAEEHFDSDRVLTALLSDVGR